MLSSNISITGAGDLVGLAGGVEGKKAKCLHAKVAIFNAEVARFGLILTHLKLFRKQKNVLLGKVPTPPCGTATADFKMFYIVKINCKTHSKIQN